MGHLLALGLAWRALGVLLVGTAAASAVSRPRGARLVALGSAAGRRAAAGKDRANLLKPARSRAPLGNLSEGNGSQGNITSLVAESPNASCLPDTGGTCFVKNCSSWRGPTDCKRGHCLCQPGHCAGADGKCYNGSYPTVNRNFTLVNVRWPEYRIYIKAYSYSLGISKSHRGDESRYVLREMGNGSGSYSLASAKYEDYMITTVWNQHCDTDTNGQCKFTYDPRAVWPGSWAGLAKASELGLKLFAAPGRNDSVMISSWQYPDWYFYIPSLGFKLATYQGDPGQGGYWTMDPPAPNSSMKLEQFRGTLCTFDCAGPPELIVVLSLAGLVSVSAMGFFALRQLMASGALRI